MPKKMDIRPDRTFQIDDDRSVQPNPSFDEKPVPNLLVALEDSIAKWVFVRDNVHIRPHDGGTYSCALCKLYYDDICEGCPIMDYTGMEFCDSTPYEDYTRYYLDRDIPIRHLAEYAQNEIDLLMKIRRLRFQTDAYGNVVREDENA